MYRTKLVELIGVNERNGAVGCLPTIKWRSQKQIDEKRNGGTQKEKGVMARELKRTSPACRTFVLNAWKWRGDYSLYKRCCTTTRNQPRRQQSVCREIPIQWIPRSLGTEPKFIESRRDRVRERESMQRADGAGVRYKYTLYIWWW